MDMRLAQRELPEDEALGYPVVKALLQQHAALVNERRQRAVEAAAEKIAIELRAAIEALGETPCA